MKTMILNYLSGRGNIKCFFYKFFTILLLLSFSGLSFSQDIVGNKDTKATEVDPKASASAYTSNSYWFYGGGGLTNSLHDRTNSVTWYGEHGGFELIIQPDRAFTHPDWVFKRPRVGVTYPVLYSAFTQARIIGAGDLQFAGGGQGHSIGSEAPHMTIKQNGYIGIGTTDPSERFQLNDGNARFENSKVYMGYTYGESLNISTANLNKYALFVGKGILSEDYAIGPKSSWKNLVFNDSYKLRSLTEVEEFIDTNNHLPELPSTKEIQEEGYSLHDMNVKLLQKVEELTLYIIQLNKEIEGLKKEK